MSADFMPPLEQLPQRTATQLKNEWAEIVREMGKFGSVAITDHGQIGMVLMDAEVYRKISTLVEQNVQYGDASLTTISATFDQRLASFKSEGIRDRVDGVMSARGRIRRRPKAGPAY